jgi:hypothetical protein
MLLYPHLAAAKLNALLGRRQHDSGGRQPQQDGRNKHFLPELLGVPVALRGGPPAHTDVLLFTNHWVSRTCPSSGIPKTIKHSVSETGFVSVLR